MIWDSTAGSSDQGNTKIWASNSNPYNTAALYMHSGTGATTDADGRPMYDYMIGLCDPSDHLGSGGPVSGESVSLGGMILLQADDNAEESVMFRLNHVVDSGVLVINVNILANPLGGGAATTYPFTDGQSIIVTIIPPYVQLTEDALDSVIETGFGESGSAIGYAVRHPSAGWVLVNAATQERQESGLNIYNPVTPAVQQFHPSAAKAWGVADGDGVGIPVSYNIDSIDDTATGVVTVNLLNDMSSANYAAVATAWRLTGQHYACGTDTHLAGSFRIVAYEVTSGAIEDPNAYSFAVYGDL